MPDSQRARQARADIPTNAEGLEIAPARLFKYVDSLAAVENMYEGRLKFASFYDLNDPSEGADVHNDEEFNKSLENLLVHGYSAIQLKCLKLQFDFAREMGIEGLAEEANHPLIAQKTLQTEFDNIHSENNQTMRDNLREFAKRLRGNLHMTRDKKALHYLCLSERYDSLPMWAHYANKSQGMVVIFKNLDKHFPPAQPWEFKGIQKVRYSKTRPPLTYDPLSLENIFLAKTNDWAYEQEYRIVKPRDQLTTIAPKRNGAKIIDRMYVYQINEAKLQKYPIIEGVIMGENVTTDTRKKLEKLINEGKVFNLYQGKNNNNGHVSIKPVLQGNE